ncbi:ABC transporter [seawater metagenome]|uniref:ABC transporter n=1 Tax=seawater metagenome TaxID=1561972 RepID=A0A5E8CKG9_9ZZZZ
MDNIIISKILVDFFKKNYKLIIGLLIFSRYSIIKNIVIPKLIVQSTINISLYYNKLVLYLIFYTILLLCYKYFNYLMGIKLKSFIQNSIYDKILNMRSYNLNENYSVGIDKHCKDISNFESLSWRYLVQIITYFIVIFSLCINFYKINKTVGVIFFGFYIMLNIVFLYNIDKIKYYKRNLINKETDLLNFFQDINTNLSTILSFNKKQGEIQNLNKYLKDHETAETIINNKYYKLIGSYNIFSNVLFISVLLVFSYLKTKKNITMTQFIGVVGIIFNFLIFNDTDFMDSLIYYFIYKEYSVYAVKTLNKNLMTYRPLSEHKITNYKISNSLALYNIEFSIQEKKLYNDLNINFYQKKINCIIGKIGTGKSTLLKLIYGNSVKYSGTISYQSIYQTNKNLEDWRKLIHYIPQTPDILNTNVKDNIFYTLKVNEIQEKYKLLKELGLMTFVNSMIYNKKNILTLSGGEKQLISIIRCVLIPKPIILLDEPTASLNFKKKLDVIKCLNYLKKTSTLIVVSHDEDLINISDSIFELNNGKLPEVTHIKKKKIN